MLRSLSFSQYDEGPRSCGTLGNQEQSSTAQLLVSGRILRACFQSLLLFLDLLGGMSRCRKLVIVFLAAAAGYRLQDVLFINLSRRIKHHTFRFEQSYLFLNLFSLTPLSREPPDPAVGCNHTVSGNLGSKRVSLHSSADGTGTAAHG